MHQPHYRLIYRFVEQALQQTDNGNRCPRRKIHGTTALLMILARLYRAPLATFLGKIEPTLGCQGTEAFAAIQQACSISFAIQGLEHIPSDKPCLLVANHPTAIPDMLAMVHLARTNSKQVAMLVTHTAHYLFPDHDRLIPVRLRAPKGAKIDYTALDRHFRKHQGPTIIFPYGYASHLQPDGSVRDGRWKWSFVRWALQYGLPIVPISIQTKASDEFYQLMHSTAWPLDGGIHQLKGLMIGLLEKVDQTIPLVVHEPIVLDHELDDPVRLSARDREWLTQATQQIQKQCDNDYN